MLYIPPYQDAMLADGAYIGGRAGASYMIAKGSESTPGLSGSRDLTSSHMQPNASVYVGYRRLFYRTYLGAEAGFLYNNQTVNSETRDTTSCRLVGHTQIKLKNAVYIDALPGFAIYRRTQLYVRLGAAYSPVKITRNQRVFGRLQHVSDTENKLGWRLGIGIETGITPNLTTHLDYVFTRYSSVSMNRRGSFQYCAHFNPELNLIEGGFTYYFNNRYT